MELIPIGDDKLKVTLSPTDMKAYRLDAAGLDWDDTGTRRALWSILDEAKRRCGFDAARERVLVQIFPSLAGGCEMFVTRVGGDGEGGIISAVAGGCRDNNSKNGSHACFFDGMNELLHCCRALEAQRCTEPSSAYACEDGRYLLIYSGASHIPYEYGTTADTAGALAYIAEHADIIRDGDAVPVLARLC